MVAVVVALQPLAQFRRTGCGSLLRFSGHAQLGVSDA
jgi:hypothetical protein